MKFWYEFDRRHFWVLLKATCCVAIGRKFTMTLITSDHPESK